MKKLFLLLFVVLFSSCAKDSFFTDFDKVEYYKLKNDLLIDYEKQKDSSIIKIFNDDYPYELNDKRFYEILNQQRFSKKIILSKDVSSLREIFRPVFHIVLGIKKCIPSYRDILIFKKNNSIVGVSKICFDCNQYRIVGNDTYLFAENFGSDEDFEALNKILKKYK